MPTADDISVLETLHKLDGEFAAMAAAVENGEFALWVGSGISRQAPDLGVLIARAIEHVRLKAIDAATSVAFEPALIEMLEIARQDEATVRPHFGAPFETWPMRKAIIRELWNNYSKLLDVRIPGEREDYMLWDAIDIRASFAYPNPPAATHLAIAILIMEGAVHEIASGNWDGFIETALARLSSGSTQLLQVIVDPDHLRDAAAKARLLKFHGCIVHATQNPALYRDFLTGSEAQIISWPNNPVLTPMKNAVTAVATNYKTLMLGLSLQDANLQGVFSSARHTHPWPWPCAPHAQGHVFCENALQAGQHTMLKTVYAGNYNAHIADIERSAHLRSWAEQVLLALVLKLLCDKLTALIHARLGATPLAAASADLAATLVGLRDVAADHAVGDRTAFANRAIATWSRALCLFRNGALQQHAETYEVLSASRPSQIGADENAKAAGLAEFGLALALLEHGSKDGRWTLTAPAAAELEAGALTATGTWAGASPRPVFLVRSATVAIALQKAGAFANDNVVVIHADDAWQEMRATGTTGARRTSRPPGRVGKVETRHISLARLVDTAADGDALKAGFIHGVVL